MAEVNNFLTAEDVGWGDVEILEAQLEQSNVIFPLTAFLCFMRKPFKLFPTGFAR